MAADGAFDSREALLSMVLTSTPHEVQEFTVDGQRCRFGRDATCDVVIPAGPELSRVAGEVWRMGDELWVRNLSVRHELSLRVAQHLPEPLLPPRRNDGFDRGPARAIPGDLTFISPPGGFELLVRQWREPRWGSAPATFSADTTVAPELPDELRPVALALCEPMLRGTSQLPASYRQIGSRLGVTSLKRLRLLVGKLCIHYAAAIPELAGRMEERRLREASQLGLTTQPRLVKGVWRFDPDSGDDDSARRRALVLPDSFEVAQLLVRRGIVRLEDVNAAWPGQEGHRNTIG